MFAQRGGHRGERLIAAVEDAFAWAGRRAAARRGHGRAAALRSARGGRARRPRRGLRRDVRTGARRRLLPGRAGRPLRGRVHAARRGVGEQRPAHRRPLARPRAAGSSWACSATSASCARRSTCGRCWPTRSHRPTWSRCCASWPDPGASAHHAHRGPDAPRQPQLLVAERPHRVLAVAKADPVVAAQAGDLVGQLAHRGRARVAARRVVAARGVVEDQRDLLAEVRRRPRRRRCPRTSGAGSRGAARSGGARRRCASASGRARPAATPARARAGPGGRGAAGEIERMNAWRIPRCSLTRAETSRTSRSETL